MLTDFQAAEIETGETSIFVRYAGSGPPALLLHGFPETHLMWHRVAPLLVHDFTVVCADLRGYGRSGCPESTPDHKPYSKRTMAGDMVAVMEHLGFARFSVVGHDRGGRVAYRLALDHPQRIERLAVLDVLPTETVWTRADARFALGFWPWVLLAQAESLPERILVSNAETIVDNALSQWGSPAGVFTADARAAYIESLQDPQHVHAICEEYRAAAAIDREHDRTDLESGRRINCPVLALWSAKGALASWYVNEGGPLALWQQWANNVRGRAIDAGHFFPEEKPEETVTMLREFLNGA